MEFHSWKAEMRVSHVDDKGLFIYLRETKSFKEMNGRVKQETMLRTQMMI